MSREGRRRVLIFFLLGIAAGILMMMWCHRFESGRAELPIPSGEARGVGLVIEPDQGKPAAYGNGSGKAQGVVIEGREFMRVRAGRREETVRFYNPKENAGLYYLSFELRLYESDGQDYEVLYTSGLVEPGQSVNKAKFSRELEKGVYDAVIHVQPCRMNEEKTLTNNADIKIRLIVD